MKPPIILIGAGGHAKVLIEALRLSSAEIYGVVDRDESTIGSYVHGIEVIGDDNLLFKYDREGILLVNAIGSTASPGKRIEVFNKFKIAGFRFTEVIHPSAVVASDVVIEEGSQIMAGAVVQPGCRIGRNSIINTRASIDHDCVIGDHVHIAPGVTVSGGVAIGEGAHVGTGASIIQGLKIGQEAVIGAGSTVIRDVPANAKVYGVPAREGQK